jgi:hypothetical protein
LRRSAISVGAVDIDALQVTDSEDLPAAVVIGRVNETAVQFNYLGGLWLPATQAGALSGNVRYTFVSGASVLFRAQGSAITIYRNTGTGTGTMSVYMDNQLVEIVDNTVLPNGVSIPYTIANVPLGQRVIRVINTSGTLIFDGAKAINQPILLAPNFADDRSLGLAYTGDWKLAANVAAYAGTLSRAESPGEVEFMFRSNHLCIAYQQQPAGSLMWLYIDGTNIATINTAGALLNQAKWCTYDNGINVLSDTVHEARLVLPVASAANPVALDYIRPMKKTIFTTSMGLIAETNPQIFYNTAFGSWATIGSISPGGYKFQGGFAKRAGTTGERLSFTMQGTGFVLYTSVAPEAGAWSVYVDGVLQNFQLFGVPYDHLDLYNDWRFRPFAVAVTDLPSGIHYIELRTRTSPLGTDMFVDFDGFRVLP